MDVREKKFLPVKEQSTKATSSTKPSPPMWKQLFSPPKSLALFLYHFCGHYYTVSHISLVIYIRFTTLVTYSTSTMKLQML